MVIITQRNNYHWTSQGHSHANFLGVLPEHSWTISCSGLFRFRVGIRPSPSHPRAALPYDDGAELAAGASHLGNSGAHLDYSVLCLSETSI